MKHDKTLIKKRFSRNLGTYDTLATVQRAIADRLGSILSHTDTTNIKTGIEIGSGTGFLTHHLVRLFPAADWTANDLVTRSRDYLPHDVTFVGGDGETLSLPEKRYDLIASASTVQWFDDLPGFIGRAADALRPGGILALSTFGPGNFREITATTGQGLDYYPLSMLETLFTTQGLHILAHEEWTEQQHYPTPTDVLRHLRLTGVNAVAAERWTHSRLRQFEADYRAAYTVKSAGNDKECVTLTFHPIILVAQKP